jgi:hypothetical protein
VSPAGIKACCKGWQSIYQKERFERGIFFKELKDKMPF